MARTKPLTRTQVQHPKVNRDEQIKRAIRVSGKFSSGLTDVSANHDRYLAEACKRWPRGRN